MCDIIKEKMYEEINEANAEAKTQWIEDNKSTLREEFCNEQYPDEFQEFCEEQYKMLEE